MKLAIPLLAACAALAFAASPAAAREYTTRASERSVAVGVQFHGVDVTWEHFDHARVNTVGAELSRRVAVPYLARTYARGTVGAGYGWTSNEGGAVANAAAGLEYDISPAATIGVEHRFHRGDFRAGADDFADDRTSLTLRVRT